MPEIHSNAESLPLLQQLPPMPTILSTDEVENSNEIVCENHNHNRKVMLKRSLVLMLIIGILSFVTFYSFKVYSQMERTINESLKMTVKDIQVNSIDPKDRSINLTLDVESSLNYSQSDLDFVTQKFLILNSYFVNNLNVALDNINITVNTSDELIDPLGTVKVSPFNLKIYQGVTDTLKLHVNIKPNSLAMFKVLKDLVLNKDILEMNGAFLLKIRVGYLRIPIRSLDLKLSNVVIDPSELINELYGHKLKLESLHVQNSGGIDSSLSLISSQDDELLAKYIQYLPSVPDVAYATVEMVACKRRVLKMFDVEISGISKLLEDLNGNLLKVSTLNLIPGELFQKCSSDGLSPISKLVQSVLYREPETKFFIRSCEKRNKEIFPSWINEEILNKLRIPYHIPSFSSFLEPMSFGSSIVQNVSLSDMDLNIDNGISRPQLQSGKVGFDISLPFQLNLTDFQIASLKGQVDLSFEGEQFGHMKIREWLKCETDAAVHTVCHFDSNEITITNGAVYALLIGDYLMGSKVEIGAEFVVDALIDWKTIYSHYFELNGLKGSGKGSL